MSWWLYKTSVGFSLDARVVIIAIAYKPQSALPLCPATLATLMMNERDSVLRYLAITVCVYVWFHL